MAHLLSPRLANITTNMLKKDKSKLTGIYLENFQSLRGEPVFLSFEKLCLFYGPNSAGKSAVIDALKVLKTTVDNPDDYRLEFLYGKHSTGPLTKQPKIGIEFIVGKFDRYGPVRDWYDSNDPDGNTNHQFVFGRAEGKKIQVEFSSNGRAIKVAYEGCPVFEILDTNILFDSAYRRISDEQRKTLESNPNFELGDSSISGQLIIYKNNALFEKTYNFCNFHFNEFSKEYSSRLKSTYFYDLFFEDLEDRTIINGIEFDAQYQDERLVNACWDARMLLDRLDDSDYEHPDEYEKENTKFLFELISNKVSHGVEDLEVIRDQIKIPKIYSEILNNLSKEYSKFLKGIFFQISSALEYSHVRGDRQVLNSNDCVSYERTMRGNFLTLKEPYRDDNDPIRIYANYLSNQKGVYGLEFKGDFVNHCFQKYMPSLKGYKIVSNTYDLVRRSYDLANKSNELIYLFVQNSSGVELGFQDVGSGISYVLPIIASVWCLPLSFIEQPELHLHPKAQCEVADIFIASLKLNNWAVIESHSEHLLLRLARRIRETTKGYLLPDELKLSPDDVNIYYFDPQPNGSTNVKRIRLDKHGELLDRWPGGFFSERDKELFDE